MKRRVLASLAIFFVSGCASVSHSSSIAQPIDRELVVGAGDVIAKITTEKSLPNAFGKADIFGRTTPTGVTTVIYEGVKDGKAYFSRADQPGVCVPPH